jgi:endonuclease/exonuclease/phosphatase family metal-dependent hydrolase
MTQPALREIVAVLLLLSIATVVRSSDKEADTSRRIRVLSYNIHHGGGIDRKLDLERIARVILSVKPDLVAIQEVDQNTDRTNKADQPAELARLTKMHVAFGGNIKFQGGQYGNAVLSKFPIRRHKNHVLPNLDDGEQRGVLEVEVEITNGLPIVLFATHLDHRAKDRERVASARKINELAVMHRGSAALLAGDLNATPESATLVEFAKQWKGANDKISPTVPVRKPTRQIDYVMFRVANGWRVVETRVLDEAVASDHRAILAVFDLTPVPR